MSYQQNPYQIQRRKPKKTSNIIARFIGAFISLILLFIVVIVFFTIKNGAQESQSTTAQNQVKKSTVTETNHEEKKTPAKYSFYDQLQQRSEEVQRELDRRKQVAENRQQVKGRHYRVQVGAFKNPDQADQMQQRMLLRKYPARIIRSGDFHLVQVGPYTTLDEAEKVQKIFQNDNIDTMIKTFVDN